MPRNIVVERLSLKFEENFSSLPRKQYQHSRIKNLASEIEMEDSNLSDTHTNKKNNVK